MTVRNFTLHGITEATPGPQWRGLFDATWPGYREWYLQDGLAVRPDLATAQRQLLTHMPELMPVYERLVELSAHSTGDAAENDIAQRMLTMWDMPAFLPGCTQAVDTRAAPVLVRNYDYSPDLFEWVSLSSRFTDRQVIGTSDCLWGLLDGMNDAGLIVSLTFGGRPGSAPGFGIPLVVRLLLEVADDVDAALARLQTIPVGMSYNLTLADRHKRAVTVFVAPGEAPQVSDLPAAANHRGLIPEYPHHAARFRSVERQQCALDALQSSADSSELAAQFLRPPLHNTSYSTGFGTLYTAVYSPSTSTVEYRWPERSFVRTFDSAYDAVSVRLREDTDGQMAVRRSSMPESPDPRLDSLSTAEVAELARRAMSVLASRADQESFSALVDLQSHAGVSLGEAARGLAAYGSWAQVGDLMGTTKQAAWSRWRESGSS